MYLGLRSLPSPENARDRTAVRPRPVVTEEEMKRGNAATQDSLTEIVADYNARNCSLWRPPSAAGIRQ